MIENNTKEYKEWIPTPDQLDIIREKYSVYNDPPRRYTKTRLLEMFKITDILFVRLVAKHKIKPKKHPVGYTRDFSKYIRVPVPCPLRCPTFILVHPDRDPEQARLKYIEKQNLKKTETK